MKMFALSVLIVGAALVFYIENLNQLTLLRLAIPSEMKRLKDLSEENQRLKYEINQFENPLYLMELLKKPEFSHLKFPKQDEIAIYE
jgi:hypothetical protein